MTVTTHDHHAATFVVEYGAKPQRDMAKITAYLKLRAERARRAKAIQAAATGPRSDEWTGIEKPIAITQGAVNPEATGPKGPEWKPPVRGRWISNGRGSERFVADPAPAHTRVERPVEAIPVQPESAPVYEGWLEGTSKIGAKPRGKDFALPCGPAPQ